MIRFFTIFISALALIGLSALSSNAGVKKIKPDQLKSSLIGNMYYQDIDSVRSYDIYGAKFYLQVKLPIGKIITKITYYHSNGGFPTVYNPRTNVWFNRSRFGEEKQEMAFCTSDDNTGTIISVEDDTINFARIKSGYTYWVDVYSANLNSAIMVL